MLHLLFLILHLHLATCHFIYRDPLVEISLSDDGLLTWIGNHELRKSGEWTTQVSAYEAKVLQDQADAFLQVHEVEKNKKCDKASVYTTNSGKSRSNVLCLGQETSRLTRKLLSLRWDNATRHINKDNILAIDFRLSCPDESCPSYNAVMNSDGSVLWHSENKHNTRWGLPKRSAMSHYDHFEHLATQFEEATFSGLEPSYAHWKIETTERRDWAGEHHVDSVAHISVNWLDEQGIIQTHSITKKKNEWAPQSVAGLEHNLRVALERDIKWRRLPPSGKSSTLRLLALIGGNLLVAFFVVTMMKCVRYFFPATDNSVTTKEKHQLLQMTKC